MKNNNGVIRVIGFKLPHSLHAPNFKKITHKNVTTTGFDVNSVDQEVSFDSESVKDIT